MVATGVGRRDARADGASERWTLQLAGLVLLVAASAGLLGQGAYYPWVQRPVGVLIAAATLLGLAGWPPTSDDLRLLPVVPAVALAAWALLDGAVAGAAGAGAGLALLLLGLVAVLLVCRRLRREDREILLAGVVGVGLLVALIGWLGVADRSGPWAFEAQGLWRASSTLTYPNATAAVLAAISLVVLGRLVGTPGRVPLVLAATGLLAGLAATMSRAGALGLVVGLVVLAALRGPGATVRAAAGPVTGALVALLALLPSMPAASPPRPALALLGPGAGLALAVLVARWRWPALALLGGVVVAGAWLLASGDRLGSAARTVVEARANLASPDRTGALHAALRLVGRHPLTGTGPGTADLRWKGSDHGTQLFAYVHNEYLQVAAELGLVGLVLLAILLVAVARLLWLARSTGRSGATWAGVVAAAAAFAVHSGFDFVWHLPAVVLTVMLLVGVVLPAPDPAPARQGSVPFQEEEPNEDQDAH